LASVAGTVLDVGASPEDEDEIEDDLVGHIFVGRYQIEKLIASGTMGRVYLGTQLRLERPVAIKILKQSGKGRVLDARFAKRFNREASVASQLAHPNIVSIYDYGETDNGRLFMAMELIEGVPLHELIRDEGPFSVERALGIAIQIARALRKAHGAGVVHRDLKPANVIVKTDEEGFDFIKVLDFGLVKLFSPEESAVSTPFDEDHLTRPGNMVGTPDYVSPEQALGDAVDGRTDIYSLGVLMFQMIAGRLPFVGASIIEMVKHHLESKIPSISEVAPGVECPEDVEELIFKAMSKMRDDRYASMDELLAALKVAWRNVTDESFGTEVSSTLPMQAVLASPPREMMLVTRRTVLDPSEESRPRGKSFAATSPKSRWQTYLAIGAGGLLLLAIASAAWMVRELGLRQVPRVIVPVNVAEPVVQEAEIVEPVEAVEAEIVEPELVEPEIVEPEIVEPGKAIKAAPVKIDLAPSKDSKAPKDYKENPF
jgi:serine/threonine-protein kinase